MKRILAWISHLCRCGETSRLGSRALILAGVCWFAANLCAPIGSAAAQSKRYPATPEDYDDQRERRSTFWDKIISPDQAKYLELISRASDYLEGRDTESIRWAERNLLEASRLLPDQPLAYWMLAVLYEGDERWQECAESYGHVSALDAAYQPSDDYLPLKRGASWALDYGQAVCHGQLGEFERAIAHYQRILQRGASQDARVYRGLGEAYMALGRLREAISALEVAKKRDPGQWLVNYPLAVAYDRVEQEARAREALAAALQHDPDIDKLEAPDLLYMPATDRYYYLGLAHEVKGQAEWAIVYFRHYAQLTGRGLWSRRIEDHLRDLGRVSLPQPESISPSDEVVGREALARAIERSRDQLHACLADTPGLLLEVRITALGASGRGRPSRIRGGVPPPTPGVKARTLYSFEAAEEQVARAIDCVETRAEDIEIPRVRGDTAEYRTVTFPLIAPR